MSTTVIEVDEDVFQITTEHSDGSVTVETVFGRDAYEFHYNAAMKEKQNERDEHTAYSGRVATAGHHSRMWH